jgi:hypothetical protein
MDIKRLRTFVAVAADGLGTILTLSRHEYTRRAD